MKRVLLLAAMALMACLAADVLRAQFVGLIDPLSPHSTMLIVLAYLTPFTLTGMAIAKVIQPFGVALFVAIAMASVVAALHIAFDGIRPVIVFSHAPWWQYSLGWANIYAPIVGALIGAIGMGRWKTRIRSDNAA